MKNNNEQSIVTCVYCGHEYPMGTPTAQHALLTAHIKICDKHPMREAEVKIEKLRKALVGIIGMETPEELRGIKSLIELAPPSHDQTVIVNAIDILLTLNEN